MPRCDWSARPGKQQLLVKPAQRATSMCSGAVAVGASFFFFRPLTATRPAPELPLRCAARITPWCLLRLNAPDMVFVHHE